jgi:uncharacterized protein
VFQKPHVFLPVVHVEYEEQALRNIAIARENGADGAFLINHQVGAPTLVSTYEEAQQEHRDFFLGVNILGFKPYNTLEFTLDRTPVAGIWSDNAHATEPGRSHMAQEFLNVRARYGWEGIYFGGVEFKGQQQLGDAALAAQRALPFVDVVTTSGVRTGLPPTVEKIVEMKDAIEQVPEYSDTPLAIASGMSPENVRTYARANVFFVFSAISRPGTENFDPYRVREFADEMEKLE